MIIIDKWAGLATNLSPYAMPAGAMVVQTNWQCRKAGEIVTRNGQSALTATTHSSDTQPVLSMMRVRVGADDCVIYQTAAGEIRVARGIQ